MKITTYESLKDLAPKVESDLEKTIQERKDMGLDVPDNYKTYIYYYNNEGSLSSEASSMFEWTVNMEYQIHKSKIRGCWRIEKATGDQQFIMFNFINYSFCFTCVV